MIRTAGVANNAMASQGLAAGASMSFSFDVTSSQYARILIAMAAGNVGYTSGVQVAFKPGVGSTSQYPTQGFSGGIISAIPGQTTSQSYSLAPCIYTCTLTNLDTSNAVSISATVDTYN